MHAEERQQTILRELRARGSIRVTDLAERLGVSAITIRRDVELLAGRRLLTRVHGGATLREPAPEPGGSANGTAADSPPPVPSEPALTRQVTIGMVVPSAVYYYPEIIRGARQAAARRDGRLVLGLSSYDAAEDRTQVERLVNSGVDGLLVTPTTTDLDWLAALDIPVVLVERHAQVRQPNLEHVVSDHTQGAYLAVRHLAGLGHTGIALVAREDSPTTPHIREGYTIALRDAGLKPGPLFFTAKPAQTLEIEDQAPFEKFSTEVREGRLHAALVHNDHDAMLLLQWLRAHDIEVPRDVAIVAYDDEVAALADTPLTAVAPPKLSVGSAAVDLLYHRLADPSRPRHRLSLLPQLRTRASTEA
ncbi:substrate-binding domain-containing protein [Actinomadura gamaensis]|uniref:Substrate-binding domain-containing protein n=1 Tax=Actinomadura gamaensis TaxID=1763541 RepID=A0ABV9TWR2_9ACTN